jgi:hypothetical protein
VRPSERHPIRMLNHLQRRGVVNDSEEPPSPKTPYLKRRRRLRG